jgi:hypothetical protein
MPCRARWKRTCERSLGSSQFFEYQTLRPREVIGNDPLLPLGDGQRPTRQQQRRMRRFASAEQAQRLLSVHGLVGNLFRVARHLMRAVHERMFCCRAFTGCQQATYGQ